MNPTCRSLFVLASILSASNQWESLDTSKVADWPKYSSKSEPPTTTKQLDEDVSSWLAELGEEGEEVDTENFEILSITDDEIVINCGGDWQPPAKIILRAVEGKLTASEVTLFADFEQGLDGDEITTKLSAA